jgi:hypothetical protein
MINKFKDYIEEKNMRADLKRSLSPTPEEMSKAKTLFMAEVRTHFPTPSPYMHHSWKMYATFAVIALIILGNGGALIYADVANVPIDHPLYSYKRVAEEVRGFTSTQSQKVKLESELAERRIDEIKKIEDHGIIPVTATTTQKNHKKQKELEDLRGNLQTHLDSLDHEAEMPEVKKEIEKTDICKGIDSNARNFKFKIKNICAPKIQEINATTTASTTPQILKSDRHKGKNNNRKENKGQD